MNASGLERVAARLSRAESEGTLWRELGRPLSLAVGGLKPVCMPDYRLRRKDAVPVALASVAGGGPTHLGFAVFGPAHDGLSSLYGIAQLALRD